MFLKVRLPVVFLIFTLLLSLFSCATNLAPSKEDTAFLEEQKRLEEQRLQEEYRKSHFEDGSLIVNSKNLFDAYSPLRLTFAGDIMAHEPNWNKGNFPRIFKSLVPLLKDSDIAFANMETPVVENLPFATYPNFNVHASYVQAAVDVGFNAFSLANNHTNDQEKTGIRATKKYFDSLISSTATSSRPVYAAGLKDNAGDPLSYQVIDVAGWKVLFCAITEILNTGIASSLIDYIPPSQRARDSFVNEIEKLREEIKPDLFVLSLHCCEPEYILTVDKKQEDWYYRLLSCGVDVLWANHPHVSKKWDLVCDGNKVPRKLIFYAMGNTISAQRTSPSFNNPAKNRDYTGDGYLANVTFIKNEGAIQVALVAPYVLTTYIDQDRFYQIEVLDEGLAKRLEGQGRKIWADYLRKREKLMKNIQGNLIWQ